MRIIDPGHYYQLLTLDGDDIQYLRFVKREGPGFPGNVGYHSGTTLQSVIRALCERVRYLQRQAWCVHNVLLLSLLRVCLWLLEKRAAKRHGKSYWHGLAFAEDTPMCPKCGHTVCDHDSQGS